MAVNSPPDRNRRQLLKTLATAGALALLPSACGGGRRSAGELIASAAGAVPEQYGVSWLRAGQRAWADSVKALAAGFRGHEVLQHPVRKHSLLFVARRPGTEVLEVDTRSGDVVAQFTTRPGQHLNGHGDFSADGQFFYTMESDIAQGAGRIVVRDSHRYQVVAEYPSFGIEPHEAKLLPDGHTLVVANGGILTHPLSGRKKLNLATMQSNLTYMDMRNGQLIDQFTLPEAKASIRHLAVAADGSVAFATQVQRQAMEHARVVALAGRQLPGGALQLFAQPEAVIAQLNDYLGSVRIHNPSRIAGFTSPRGNLAVFWHMDSGNFAGYHRFHDVCGLACSGDQRHFVLSNSLGQLRRLDAQTLQEDRSLRANYPGTAWDNHLLISAG